MCVMTQPNSFFLLQQVSLREQIRQKVSVVSFWLLLSEHTRHRKKKRHSQLPPPPDLSQEAFLRTTSLPISLHARFQAISCRSLSSSSQGRRFLSVTLRRAAATTTKSPTTTSHNSTRFPSVFCTGLRHFATTSTTSTIDNMTVTISAALLARQDDQTSEAVLNLLKGSAAFEALSAAEGNDIVTRDQEDDVKLAVGIQYAVAKGVLPKDPHVDPVTKIVVTGKSADEVANEIIKALPSRSGNVIVLQGLSGTGKGTTVKRLQATLPHCVCWSNGNVFRTFTHLASQHCEAQGVEFGKDVMTPELLKSFVERLAFEKFDDCFDVTIDGTIRVNTIQNTTLKMPLISCRVPTVAELTQGEVVLFAAKAVATLKDAGCNVILEGRAQTLNYIPSPLRFELVMENVSLLGERRAAQRVMAAAQKALGESAATASDDVVTAAVLKAVEAL